MKVTNKSSSSSWHKRKTVKRQIVAQPISFVQKFYFLKSVILSRNLTALDHKIALIISERYIDAFGNAEASLSYLQVGTGASRQGVIDSLARLKKCEAIFVVEGYSGSRSTRYRPNLNFARSQAELTATGQADLTSDDSQAELTTTGQDELTKDAVSGQAELTQYHLRTPPTAEVTLSGQTAPALGAGLAAAPREAVDRKEWEVVAASIESEGGDTSLVLSLRDGAGETDEASICIESNNLARQVAGQRTLERLSTALDRSVYDGSELIGLRVYFDDRCELRPVPANDNVKYPPTALTFSAAIPN